MIRRALMALFAVMTPSQVLAADWALVATSSNDVRQYLDVGSVSRNGDDRSIWVKEIDPETAAHGEAYSVLHWRYDCSARTGTLLSWMQYRANGTLIDSEQIPSYKQSAIDLAPDTVGERMLNTVCG